MKHLVFISLSLSILPLSAQNPQSTVENPTKEKQKAPQIDKSNETFAASHDILIPALKGLCLANTSSAALGLQSQPKNAVTSTGFSPTQQSALQKNLSPYLGKPISLAVLDEIARRAEVTLDPSPSSLLIARFPPQEITSGYIAIYLSTPTIQNISFTGRPVFGKNFYPSAVSTRPDGDASAQSIRNDLEFLNRNPFRKASVIWQPIPDDDLHANLLYRIDEKKPWSIFSGFDTYASDALGNERIYLGGRFGNIFELDHRLSWLALGSTDFEALRAVQFSYEIPLPKHQILHFSTGYTESKTTSPTTLLENNGQFSHFRSYWETPLPDLRNIHHLWKTGFSLRDNTYQQGLTETQITHFQLENSWESKIYDRWGNTEITTSLAWNPGEKFISSSDATYSTLGAEDSDSLIANFTAERTIPLQTWGSLLIRANAQLSDQNLLSSDQFLGTGYNRVRGYDESTASYDNAVLLSAEWRANRIRLPNKNSIQPLAFFDSVQLNDDAGASESLNSLGFGLNWNLNNHFASRLEIAFPLSQHLNEKRQPEIHFSVNTFW